jgi:hypothetical protein
MCVVLTDGGVGYACRPTSAVIVPLPPDSDGSDDTASDEADERPTPVPLIDPEATLAHCRNASHCRGLAFAHRDAVLLALTAASSLHGCPLLTAYCAATGRCLARFCCPYAHNFDHLDVATTDGQDTIVLADDGGKLFFFRLHL